MKSVWPNNSQLKQYGLTRIQFIKILELQGGKCAVCAKVPPQAIDHDHKTGKVRGLLCTKCNTGLGLLGDNLDGVVAATLYLMRPQHD